MRTFLNAFILGCFSILFFAGCQNEAAEYIQSIHKIPVANAGPSRSVTYPVTTATLNGSGSSENGPIVGYLWSMISGPGNALIQTPGAKNTVISNLVTGSYIFQLMVVDSAGYTGVDTASVNVTSPASPVQQTIILQPAANAAELNFAAIGTANASAQDIDLDAGAWTSAGQFFPIRGATKFDLSSIPANATIVSAKLSLYSNPTPINGDLTVPNSGTNNAMWIRRVTSVWNASSTWNTIPAVETANQILIPHTNQTSLDLIDLDVKNMVASMVSSGNYGFMMGLQNEVTYNIRQFASSRHPIATKHPKLVVVYQ